MIGVRLGPGVKVREFPVSDTALFFSFLCFCPQPCWLTMSLVVIFFRFVSEKCREREWSIWTKEQSAAWFPSALCFPSTSASRTLHQQKSGHLGSENNSRETRITPRCLHYMLQAITGKTGGARHAGELNLRRINDLSHFHEFHNSWKAQKGNPCSSVVCA